MSDVSRLHNSGENDSVPPSGSLTLENTIMAPQHSQNMKSVLVLGKQIRPALIETCWWY